MACCCGGSAGVGIAIGRDIAIGRLSYAISRASFRLMRWSTHLMPWLIVVVVVASAAAALVFALRAAAALVFCALRAAAALTFALRGTVVVIVGVGARLWASATGLYLRGDGVVAESVELHRLSLLLLNNAASASDHVGCGCTMRFSSTRAVGGVCVQ